MDDLSDQKCPTILAFQRENICRLDMDAASYACAFGIDKEDTERLKGVHSVAISRWLDAVEMTRAAHAASLQAASDNAVQR